MKYPNLTGKAFRGRDGLVRWLHWLSKNGNYSMRWLDEQTGIWHIGGHCKRQHWDEMYGGDDVSHLLPVPGTSFRLMGILGTVREEVA